VCGLWGTMCTVSVVAELLVCFRLLFLLIFSSCLVKLVDDCLPVHYQLLINTAYLYITYVMHQSDAVICSSFDFQCKPRGHEETCCRTDNSKILCKICANQLWWTRSWAIQMEKLIMSDLPVFQLNSLIQFSLV